MTDGGFSYHELLCRHAPETANVYVVEQGSATTPPRALYWSLARRAWAYGPDPVDRALTRRREPGVGGVRTVGRAEAEAAAVVLGATLPAVGELLALLDALQQADADARAAAAAQWARIREERARTAAVSPPPPSPPPEPSWWVLYDLDRRPVTVLVEVDATRGVWLDRETSTWRQDSRWV